MGHTLEYARACDESDKLKHFRKRFHINPNQIYLDGNSLGLISMDAEQAVLKALDDWKNHAIHGWTEASEPWFTLAETLGAKTAPLIGALAHEVVVTGTTTTNLHNLVATFYQPSGARRKILADAENFPSDLYALASHLAIHGCSIEDLVLVKAREDGLVHTEDILALMNHEVALVLLPSVWYKSGQLANIQLLTEAAHAQGIVIGFDCAHSIGSVPHQLHADNVDFAVWCNYKYLNGGPGATAGLFVHERHHDKNPGLAGWFSSQKDKQFNMAFPLEPASTAGKFQISTPHVLSTVAVGASLDMFAEAGITNIREKSLQQTRYLRDLIEDRIIGMGLGGRIVTPVEDGERGGHIAFAHPHATQICKALRAASVIPDFRPPDIIRLAPVALYTSYEEIWRAVDILQGIIADKLYEKFSSEREIVS